MVAQQYTDEFEVDGGSAQAGEFELVPEGTYLLEITGMEPFRGTKYQSTEPQDSVKVVFTIAADPMNGDWAGESVDAIYPLVKNMANDRAGLHKLWKAATGETPQEGVKYKLKAGLMGKRVLGAVVHKTNERGSTWPRLASISPPPQAQARRRGPAPATEAPPDTMPDA